MSKTNLSIRISAAEKSALNSIAQQAGMDLSTYIRKLLQETLTEKEKSLTDSQVIFIKAASELLFMTRAISDKIEPNIKEQAKDYGIKMLESLQAEVSA